MRINVKSQAEQMREMCAELAAKMNLYAGYDISCAIQALPLPEVARERVDLMDNRERIMQLANTHGAELTGKPDGSEAITVVFSIPAWRSFSDALTAPVQPSPAKVDTEQPDHIADADNMVQPVSTDEPVAQDTDSRAEFEEWNSKQKLPWGDAAWPYLDVQVMIYDRSELVWKARQQEIDTLRESNATTLLHFDGINKELQELLVENAALKAKLEPKVWKELSDEDLIKLWITELDKGLCVTSPEIILRASIAADRELNRE